MANNLAGTVRTVWEKGLQAINRKDFQGMRITDAKFSNWKGLGTIKFGKQAKTTGGALNNYFDAITKSPIVTTNESFTPDIIRYTAIEVSLDDTVHSYIDPKGQYLVDTKEYFASEREKAIFSEAYARADNIFDDGDLKTATNTGAGNPFVFSEANSYEVLVGIRTKLTKALVPNHNRWLILWPDETGELLLSDRFAKSTVEAEKRLNTGIVAVATGMEIIESNNLIDLAGVRHCLAGQGKPVSFGWVIAPKVFVSSIDENTEKFTGVIKATEKFGVKVFDQGAQNLMDVQVKTA